MSFVSKAPANSGFRKLALQALQALETGGSEDAEAIEPVDEDPISEEARKRREAKEKVLLQR